MTNNKRYSGRLAGLRVSVKIWSWLAFMAFFLCQTMPASGGNPVEPLSNGLRLTMTRTDIIGRFGQPKPNWDRGILSYGSFNVITGGSNYEIWHFTITGTGVTLSSGIGVGSSRGDVAAVFGNPSGGEYGLYKLVFTYSGNNVTAIKIDPAKGSFITPQAKTAQKGGAKGGTLNPYNDPYSVTNYDTGRKQSVFTIPNLVH